MQLCKHRFQKTCIWAWLYRSEKSHLFSAGHPHTRNNERFVCSVSSAGHPGQLCPEGGAGQGYARPGPSFRFFTAFYTKLGKDSRKQATERDGFQSKYLQTYLNVPAYFNQTFQDHPINPWAAPESLCWRPLTMNHGTDPIHVLSRRRWPTDKGNRCSRWLNAEATPHGRDDVWTWTLRPRWDRAHEGELCSAGVSGTEL